MSKISPRYSMCSHHSLVSLLTGICGCWSRNRLDEVDGDGQFFRRRFRGIRFPRFRRISAFLCRNFTFGRRDLAADGRRRCNRRQRRRLWRCSCCCRSLRWRVTTCCWKSILKILPGSRLTGDLVLNRKNFPWRIIFFVCDRNLFGKSPVSILNRIFADFFRNLLDGRSRNFLQYRLRFDDRCRPLVLNSNRT